MVFVVLLLLKLLIFMDISKIVNNIFLIFLVSSLFILLIFTSLHFSNFRRKNILGLVIYSFISIILFVDVMYYSYFGTLPTVRLLSALKFATDAGASIRDVLTLKNALFLMDIPFLLVYLLKNKQEEKSYSKYMRWGIPGVLLMVLIITLTILNSQDLLRPISNQEPFTYHIRDIADALTKEDENLSNEELIVKELEKMRGDYELIDGKYTGIGSGKNLIVLQVEALQNFVINLEYEGQEITPNLNRLIRESGTIYFDNYYQMIGRGNTSDAEFITNNSLHPSMEEATYIQYGEDKFYGLPWILRDHGYNSWVFHGYEKEFWNRETAYEGQGFQRFISQEDYDLVETIGWGISDEEFYKQSLEYLKELDGEDKPFHGFMISLTSHNPFEIPEDYHQLEIGEDYEGTILGNYFQTINYADRALGTFIDGLKREGLYENTVIALYGDHFALSASDEGINEIMTSFLGKAYDTDEMFNIPLLIHVPGAEIKETISKVGSMIDFLPTILNIMGIENEKGLMFGKDLVNYQDYNYVAPQYYLHQGSFIDQDAIYIMSADGIFENGRAKDLATGEEIDVEPLKEKYLYIMKEVEKSVYVLKNNLIEE